MEIISGFVTKCSRYKDNDAILNLINENGEDSIIIRGAYSKNSKYLKYAKTFYVGEFETYRGNYAHKKLKDVEVIEDFNLLFIDFDKIIYLQFFQEFFSKIYSEEDSKIFFKLIILCLQKIKETQKYEKYTFLFLGYAIKIAGYGINVDSFNSRVSKVNSLSITDGKLVSSDKEDSTTIKLNQDEIISIVNVFTQKFLITEKNLNDKTIDYMKLIKALSLFYEFYSDNKIISLSLL